MKKKSGFSIHELMISLFLINLVVFALLGVVTTLLKSSQTVNENSKGAIAASSILDRYVEGEITKDKKSGKEDFSGETYYYRIEDVFVRKAETGIPGLRQITITVSTSEDFKVTAKEIKITTLKLAD